jgi:4-alpha-glucanotransferase
MSDRVAGVPPFPPGYRASGVLLHVTSLPSAYSIGDLGPGAFAWVDRLHDAGQRWWQALPLGPTGYGDSPYQCLSSFAGNGLPISPDGLIDDGLLRAVDCAGMRFRRPPSSTRRSFRSSSACSRQRGAASAPAPGRTSDPLMNRCCPRARLNGYET